MSIPILSVRVSDSGGGVATSVKSDTPITTSRIVLLIHGYNNYPKDARESYAQFLEKSGLSSSSGAGQVYGFLWPGDTRWGEVVSAASYPLEIKPAKKSANVLSEFLTQNPAPGGWPLEITLVCHSLGNRVALELIDKLIASSKNPVRIVATCLMAAAVPVRMVEDGENLNAPALATGRSLVLYSENDWVLHWAFPVGETLALEGFFPKAVGRFGEPLSGVWSRREAMTGYGHSDYWSGEKSTNMAALFLNAAVERILNEYPTSSRHTPFVQRTAERDIASRNLVSRELPMRNSRGG